MVRGGRRLAQPARHRGELPAPLLVRLALALALTMGASSASLTGAKLARADTIDDARAAYERGAEAFRQKRYKEAAKELARADELAPNAVTLQQALRAAAKSDEPGVAMELADRAIKRGGDEALVKSAQALRETFLSRAGKLSIQCADARPCTARVDASVVPVGVPRWVSAGEHQIEIDADGKSSSYVVSVAAGGTLDWRPLAPSSEPAATPTPTSASAPTATPTPTSTSAPTATPTPAATATPTATPTPPPPDKAPSGISPVWFGLGAGVTVALAAAATGAGIYTLNKHDLFVNGQDSAGVDGKRMQANTNWLLLGATLAGTGTVVLGILTFKPRAPKKSAPSAAVSLSPGGALVRVRY